MSSLLAGPSSISPWIEDTCFRALVDGPYCVKERPRLAQVLTTRIKESSSEEEYPSFLVIHDGKTLAVAFVSCQLSSSDTNGLPTRGAIVRISDWNVSLVEHVAGSHLQEILQKRDAASSYLEEKPRLCLDVAKVEVLGEIGIVGHPIPVHQSIQVRRALLSLEQKKVTLKQQLKLVAPLGNVQELFASGQTNVIDTLFALNKNNTVTPNEEVDGVAGAAAASTTTAATAPTTNTGGVVFGDVRVLLESSRNKQDNLVQQLFEMANKNHDATSTAANVVENGEAKDKATTNASSNGNVVLGDVAALMESNSMDQIFAAAAAASSTTTTATTARPSESTQDDNDDDINQQQQQEEQQPKDDEQEEKEEQRARAVEPYGMRERVDNRASVISLSGIQSVLKSVLGRASFISAPEPATDQQAEEEEEMDSDEAMTQEDDAAQSQEDDQSESDAEVVGISDMLVSQTQDDSTQEMVVEEMAVKAAVAGESVVGEENREESQEDDDDGSLTDTLPATQPAVNETVVEEAMDVEETVVNEESRPGKRPLEEAQEDDDDGSLNETQPSTQAPAEEPATQPPAPQESDGYVPMNDDDGQDANMEEAVAAVKRKKKKKRPKKVKRKGMLTVWKEQRARRKEKQLREKTSRTT